MIQDVIDRKALGGTIVLQYLIPLYLLHLRQFTNCPVRTKTKHKHDERLSVRKSQLALFWTHALGTTEQS